MTRGRVPGNRWDLVGDDSPEPMPRVSVIVAHYDQPRELARTLSALARQDYPADLLEVIVADDGSSEHPAAPAGVRIVRQADEGFRLAAVRNLGVGASSGQVICFLDADTTPEPGYVRALTRLPGLIPEAVTVGRRRHANLGDVAVDAPIADAVQGRMLDEPAWLADAYARSRDLLDADDRSYRYVIGAVMACTRSFFDEVGGFDETFTSYGGEDWEWAHRAWQAGAVFAHVPDAVAWHDGPDWAGRDGAGGPGSANAQTLRLASVIPVAGSGGRGLLTREPDVVVRLRGAHSAASVFVCVDSVLAAFPRARVVLDAVPDVAALQVDPRVIDARDGVPDARVTWTLDQPVGVLAEAVPVLAARFETLGAGAIGALELRSADGRAAGSVVARRAQRRAARWGDDAGFGTERCEVPGLVVLRADPHVEAYVGGWGSARHLG